MTASLLHLDDTPACHRKKHGDRKILELGPPIKAPIEQPALGALRVSGADQSRHLHLHLEYVLVHYIEITKCFP
jgi:hypothetical protein